MRKEAEEVMKQALQVSGELFNRSVHPTIHFTLGDLVYIEDTNIKMTCPSNKLTQCHYGLFEVIQQVNEASYKLRLSNMWHLKHLVFHRNPLSRHWAEHSPQQLLMLCNPLPSLDDHGEEVYNVEAIANSLLSAGLV